MTKYSHLYFHIHLHENDDRIEAVLWVRRNEKDGESLTGFTFDNEKEIDEFDFSDFEAKAKEAIEQGKHVCSQCKQVKDTPYFYFAAKYCKECYDNNSCIRDMIANAYYD